MQTLQKVGAHLALVAFYYRLRYRVAQVGVKIWKQQLIQ